jgi:hypothetical protein
VSVCAFQLLAQLFGDHRPLRDGERCMEHHPHLRPEKSVRLKIESMIAPPLFQSGTDNRPEGVSGLCSGLHEISKVMFSLETFQCFFE